MWKWMMPDNSNLSDDSILTLHIKRFWDSQEQKILLMKVSIFWFSGAENFQFHMLAIQVKIRLCFFFFLRSTQGGEITVYGMTETAWQVSSIGLHVVKHRHDYRLKHPQGRQNQKQHEPPGAPPEVEERALRGDAEERSRLCAVHGLRQKSTQKVCPQKKRGGRVEVPWVPPSQPGD